MFLLLHTYLYSTDSFLSLLPQPTNYYVYVFYSVISLVTSNNPLYYDMCVLESTSLRQKGWNLLHRFLIVIVVGCRKYNERNESVEYMYVFLLLHTQRGRKRGGRGGSCPPPPHFLLGGALPPSPPTFIPE